MDIWAISTFWLLWKSCCDHLYTYFCMAICFHFPLVISKNVLLSHMAILCLTFWGSPSPQTVSTVAAVVYTLLAMFEGSNFLPTLVTIFFFFFFETTWNASNLKCLCLHLPCLNYRHVLPHWLLPSFWL
jgi:hypothetical protein